MSMDVIFHEGEVDGLSELMSVMLKKLKITSERRTSMQKTVDKITEETKPLLNRPDERTTWTASTQYASFVLNNMLIMSKLWVDEQKKLAKKGVALELNYGSLNFIAIARQIIMNFLKMGLINKDEQAVKMVAQLKQTYPDVFNRLNLPHDERYNLPAKNQSLNMLDMLTGTGNSSYFYDKQRADLN